MLNIATKQENKRWRDFYALPPDSIDVIFMGNSHDYTAFQPQIIDRILPVNSYVLGIGGENIVLTYYELKELLRYQHPKLIVLETFAVTLAGKYMPPQNYYAFLDAGRWNSDKLAVAAKYLKPETLYTIFPALRTRMDYANPGLYLNQFKTEISRPNAAMIDPALGAEPIGRVIPDFDYSIAMIKIVEKFPPQSPDMKTYLDKIVQLCRENGIQLVLTRVPMVNWLQSSVSSIAPFDTEEYAVEQNVPFIKFDRSSLTHLHFVNNGHVNIFGSVNLSIQMAQKIGEILNVPVDVGQLAYYQSFVFSDYKFAGYNDAFGIQLYPRNDGMSLEYDWSVTDLSTGKTVLSSGWNKSDKYQFTLDHGGIYGITVTIRNTDGNFEMAASFPPFHKD
jgi:hypothetical protein